MIGLQEIEGLRSDRLEEFKFVVEHGTSVFRSRKGNMKGTEIMLSPDTTIEFQEYKGGLNQVVSHSVPQEGVDFLVQDGVVFTNPSRTMRRCEILYGPCVSDARSIGTLHLGTERLVARAVREAQVLAR